MLPLKRRCIDSIARPACPKRSVLRHMSDSELGGLAARRSAAALQRPRPCTAAALRENCCTAPGTCLVLAVFIRHSGVKRAAALTWWRENVLRLRVTGSAHPPAALRLQDVRVSHAFSGGARTFFFTGVARLRPLLTQGWRTNLSLCCKLLCIWFCFLAIAHVFIRAVTAVQPCHQGLHYKVSMY